MSAHVTSTLPGVQVPEGVVVRWHVLDINSGADIGSGSDDAVELASTFKVPVLLEFFQQAAAGTIDLTERVRIPGEGRSSGPTGLSVMQDDIELSWRDLAVLMMSISDNAATDVIFSKVGIDNVSATVSALGLHSIRLPLDCRGIYGQLLERSGASDFSQLAAAFGGGDTEAAAKMVAGLWAGAERDLAAEATVQGTPREMARLLQLIWTDKAAPAEACEQIRQTLSLQVFRNRLASGFPVGVEVAGKTGTLPFLHAEVGVVIYPNGERYAAAVFISSRSPSMRDPDLDRLVGRVARAGVDQLRG